MKIPRFYVYKNEKFVTLFRRDEKDVMDVYYNGTWVPQFPWTYIEREVKQISVAEAEKIVFLKKL